MASNKFEARLGLDTKEFDQGMKRTYTQSTYFARNISRIFILAAAGATALAKASVDAAIKSGELSDAGLGTVKQLRELSQTFQLVKEEIGKAILESDKFKKTLSNLETFAEKVRKRGVIGAIFVRQEKWNEIDAEKAKWDVDRLGNPIKPKEPIKYQVNTLAKLNEELKYQQTYLQNINVHNLNAIRLQQKKIQALKDEIEQITNYGKLVSKIKIASIDFASTYSKNKLLRELGLESGLNLQGGPSAKQSLVNSMNDSLERQKDIVGELTNVFNNMFNNVDKGFKGMIESMLQGLKRWVAELMARAAVFGLLQFLMPGTQIASMAQQSLWGMTGMPGQGLNGLFKGMSGGGTKVEVVGTISGKDIALSQRRYNQ